jgi:HEAT repeat protein
MKRLLVLAFVASLQVRAGPQEKSQEVAATIARMLSGEMSQNAATNRLTYLGAGGWAVDYMAELLKREFNPKRRLLLVEAVAAIAVASPAAESVLGQATTEEDISLRLAGVRGLARLKSARATPTLLNLLKDPMVGVRREAARSIGQVGLPSAGVPLMRAAAKEEDLEARALMLVAVGRVGAKTQRLALEKVLDSKSEVERTAAGQALCLLGAPRGVAFAKSLLTSPESAARLQGVLLFEGASAKQARRMLEPMLADTSVKVRANAARVMAAGGDWVMADWLVVESFKAQGDDRVLFENEIEKLRLTDEQRQSALRKAGIK